VTVDLLCVQSNMRWSAIETKNAKNRSGNPLNSLPCTSWLVYGFRLKMAAAHKPTRSAKEIAADEIDDHGSYLTSS
jgi:hypothetical protein